MEFRTIKPEEIETAFTIGGAAQEEFSECLANYKKQSELFVGCFEHNRMVGVCYGWPIFHERDKLDEMYLSVIAVLPAYRRKGIGSKVFKYWEEQVKKSGDWVIDIGSAADEFYLKNGCIPFEYCLKIHKENLSEDVYSSGAKIAFIRYAEYPLIVIYVKTDGMYNPEMMEQLKVKLKAEEGLYIFKKRVGNAA